MSCGHERQRAHRYFLLTGHPASRPGCLGECSKERYARAAHQPKLFGKTRECAFPKRAVLHKIVLFESRQRCLVAPREAQCSVGEYPLGVDDVSQDLFDRPLSWRIPEASVPL